MSKGYERKNGRIYMRFCKTPSGLESCNNYLDTLGKPWYRARYSFRIYNHARGYVTVVVQRIRRD